MPTWLTALLICLGAIAVGGLLGTILFYTMFAPLYRRDR